MNDANMDIITMKECRQDDSFQDKSRYFVQNHGLTQPPKQNKTCDF